MNGFVYSSLAGYTNTRKRDDFVHYQMVLDYFGGDTQQGRTAYRQFVYRSLNKGAESPLEIGKGSGIVGSESFIDLIKARYLSNVDVSDHREQPQLKKMRSSYSPEALIDEFCDLTGTSRDEICRKGRNSIERSMLMELLYRFCKIKQPEIGRYLGNIDYSAVSVSRKRLRLKMGNDGVLKQKFDAIVNDLSRIFAPSC